MLLLFCTRSHKRRAEGDCCSPPSLRRRNGGERLTSESCTSQLGGEGEEFTEFISSSALVQYIWFNSPLCTPATRAVGSVRPTSMSAAPAFLVGAAPVCWRPVLPCCSCLQGLLLLPCPTCLFCLNLVTGGLHLDHFQNLQDGYLASNSSNHSTIGLNINKQPAALHLPLYQLQGKLTQGPSRLVLTSQGTPSCCLPAPARRRQCWWRWQCRPSPFPRTPQS